MKLEIGNSIIKGGDFNTLLSGLHGTRQNINKEIEYLNKTLNQLNLIDNYKAFYPRTDYTFFSSTYGIPQDRLFVKP